MDGLQPGDPGAVGGYRLLGRLGAGGMGQVFLGVSPGGRKVAVKLIHPVHAGTEQFRERFAREIEAARLVGGFHTAPVVDADPHADPPWMVTAYIDGPSLQDVVDRDGPLPPERVSALGAGLAEGLAAIHACGLVHRDLKPANVILAADGPRIIDFGIARVADATALTTAGVVVGTYAYMSPEQVRGDLAGPASDMFSLGSVLAFAATGRPPFGHGAPASVMYRIATEAPDLAGLADPGLAGLITACLAKAPRSRPEVRSLLTALSSSALSSTPPVVNNVSAVSHHPPTATSAPARAPQETAPPYVAPAPARTGRARRRTALLAAAAVAVVLAVLIPVVLITSNRGPSKRQQDNAAGVNDPTPAASTDSAEVISNLRARDHGTGSASGYNQTIRVGFTVPRSGSVRLKSLQYGLNAATVSGTWTVPGTPGSSVQESIRGLTNGTSYDVYVRGCDGAGVCGPWAGPSNQVTPYGPPREPSLSAHPSGTSVTYTWGGGGGNGRPVSTYHVCFDGSCSDMAAGSVTKSYGNGQTHTITAYAIDAAGQQSPTASTSATTAGMAMKVVISQGPIGGNQSISRCETAVCHWADVTVTNAPPGTTLSYACSDETGQLWPSSGTTDMDWFDDVIKTNASGAVSFRTTCAWTYWATAGHTLRVVVNGTTGTYTG